MIEDRPIILIGAARSGTKFLRDVLAAAKGVSAVPYDVNYVWRYGAEGLDHDVLDPQSLTPQRAAFIRKTLRSLAKCQPGDVLIEKSVSNTLRVPFVDHVYPQARYIHLLRDGRAVAESAMRQWRAPPDWSALWTKLRGIPLANIGYVAWFAANFVKGLASGRGSAVWGPRYPGIEADAAGASLAEICARQWVESETAATRDLAALPDANRRVFTIRYEDLVADESALRNLLVALDLPDHEAILKAYRAKLRPVEKDQWQALPEADRAAFQRILSPVLAQKGYDNA